MKLPTLTEIASSREMIDVFKGYNNNLRIGEGEFHDMKNLTSDDYPVLSPRKQRGLFLYDDNSLPTNPQGLIAKDSLCFVDGADFVINGYKVSMNLSTDEEDCPKQLISMGAYVIILPDKKWIKITTDKEATSDYEHGDIEASVETQDKVSFTICKADGSSYEGITDSAPDEPKDMDLWLDKTTTPHVLKQWSTTSAMWNTIATTYVKISATGIGVPFAVNDAVTISGILNEELADLNGTMIIWAKDDNSIVVTGIVDIAAEQTESIKIERRMPEMDFVIESENRLWGCRYGVAANGEVVNEIYASKLGDFKNWNVFHTPSLSTDSYVVSLGSDGQFTGAITHLGNPIFFKENCMHKVYGNYPANYQITTTTCRGVQKGSHKSLAIVNEVLYYKSRASICVYDGSLPQEISYSLGNIEYSNAVACSHGNKYYISMQNDSTGEWNLFVYDSALGLWHKDDNTEVYDFCSCRGELYFIDHTDEQNVRIKTMFGSGIRETSKVKWMAETGLIGTDAPDQKYISKINVRMYAELNAIVYVYIQYDSSNVWEPVYRMAGMKLQSFTIPIRPRRCDHLKLRFEGEGVAKIFSIAKTIEQGSDVL